MVELPLESSMTRVWKLRILRWVAVLLGVPIQVHQRFFTARTNN